MPGLIESNTTFLNVVIDYFSHSCLKLCKMCQKRTLDATFLDCLALTFYDVIGKLLPEWACLTLQGGTTFLLTSKLADIPVSRVRILYLMFSLTFFLYKSNHSLDNLLSFCAHISWVHPLLISGLLTSVWRKKYRMRILIWYCIHNTKEKWFCQLGPNYTKSCTYQVTWDKMIPGYRFYYGWDHIKLQDIFFFIQSGAYSFCPVCLPVTLTFALTLNRKRWRLHIWHAYSNDDALSKYTKVNDLATLTLTFVLKIASFTLLQPGAWCFTNTCFFLCLLHTVLNYKFEKNN